MFHTYLFRIYDQTPRTDTRFTYLKPNAHTPVESPDEFSEKTY